MNQAASQSRLWFSPGPKNGAYASIASHGRQEDGGGEKRLPHASKNRVRHHVLGTFGDRELKSFSREELQDFRDAKERNPADRLFTPGEARKPRRKPMNWKEVQQLFAVLDLRERLMAILAVVAGMRPSEILALQWKDIQGDAVVVRRRVCRGRLDRAKTERSVPDVAVPAELQSLLADWRTFVLDGSPSGWCSLPNRRARSAGTMCGVGASDPGS